LEDIVHGVFAAEQQQVTRRLGEVLDAVGTKDFQRLASYHLDSPKFSKSNDNVPLKRQGVDLSNRIEQDELGSPKLLRPPKSRARRWHEHSSRRLPAG
jgi:hypothetical protein